MAKIFTSLNDPELVTMLVGGAVGIVPTDTVYGLTASAFQQQAVTRMYGLKAREKKPGTSIAASVEQLAELGIDQHRLEQAALYWPDAISIILRPAESFAYIHQGVGDSPFRVVNDSALRSLLLRTGPLVTTSANQPGEPPAQTLKEAQDYFRDAVDFYVDDGERSNRPPSTIVRITDKGLEIIRQGVVAIPPEALATPTNSPKG